MERNRPIRIAGNRNRSEKYKKPHTNNKLTKGASGSTSDRRHAFITFAENHPSDPIDVIIGDWMSEANMTVLAGKKADGDGNIDYEPTFLEALQPAMPSIARHEIKAAVNTVVRAQSSSMKPFWK